MPLALRAALPKKPAPKPIVPAVRRSWVLTPPELVEPLEL